MIVYTLNVQNRQIHLSKDRRTVLSKIRGSIKPEVTTKEYRASFWSDENVLKVVVLDA
jgi:hypothetical protein